MGGAELAVDEAQPNAFYVLPPPPRVAVSNGTPDIELLRFVDAGRVTGGHLRFVTTLAHPPEVLAHVRAQLADEARIDADAVILRPVPVEDASAEVIFLGRETTADGGLTSLVRRGFGRTVAQSVPPHTAAFSVALTPDGVRLMEAALASGDAPIAVVCRLTVEGLWPAHQVVARVDWARVYDHFSFHYKEGNLLTVTDIQSVTERLIEDRVVSIRVVHGLVPPEGESATPVDIGPAVAWVQREIVERTCEPLMALSREPARAWLGTMGEIFGVGMSFAVKKLTQIERSSADFDLQRQIVVSRTLTVQAHLADIGTDARAPIVDAGPNHPFFERMVLNVRAAQPLEQVWIDEAVLSFGYGTETAAGRLTREQPVATFDTWADRSPDRRWTVQPEVTFSATAPFDAGQRLLLASTNGDGRELALDLVTALGLRQIDVEARVDPRVLLTRATLRRQRAGQQSSEQVLTFAANGPASQPAWFRDCLPGDRFDAATEFLLADGRMVKTPAAPFDTRVLRLPPPFPGSMTVSLMTDDDWSGLERVVVSLQKKADLPAGVFTFDKGGQVTDVKLDMPDPADRTFRYRVARTFGDGTVEEDDWVVTDVPVVLVGRVAATKLVVDVSTIGPELPTAGVRLIEVDLSYIDVGHRVRDVQKAVLAARVDRFRWEVAIADPNRRSYEYRVTVHRLSGASQIGPWTTTNERLLVVPVTAQ